MIEGHIDPADLRELNRDLRALHPKKLVGPELNPMGKRVVKTVGRYPPSIGHPRTGHLGRSWYHQLFGLDLKVGNLAHYAGWVSGDEQIERHKRTGWRRLFDVAVDEADKLIKKLAEKAGRIWT